MSKLAFPMKVASRWLKPEDPVTISNGVLLYAPNVIRAAAIIFCVVGILFSIPYAIEHRDDARLVITRLFVVGLACVATAVVGVNVERHYKTCVLACVLLGTTVTLATPAYMDGPNINPHAMLATVFVLGAGFCLGRRGIVISLAWLVLNYVLLVASANLDLWPHPTNIPVSEIQYENTSAMFFMLLSLIPVLLGYLAVVERSIAELQKSHDDQAHLLQRLIVTRENERTQLSHALHEGPVQDLVALRYGVWNGMDPEKLVEIIDAATLKLRTVSSELHPSDLELYGLPFTLSRLAKQQEKESGIQIDVSLPDKVCANKEVSRVLYRIAQEALNNVRHHSGARHAWLSLAERGDTIMLEVRDDGQGFDVEPVQRKAVETGHFGLATLHELETMIKGKLEISSRPGEGTTVRVSVPVDRSAEENTIAITAQHEKGA